MAANMLASNPGICTPGSGYGLDFPMYADPDAAGGCFGKGTYRWQGAAGTWFWIDPANDLIVVGMIQQMAGAGAGEVAGIPEERGLSHAYIYPAMLDTPLRYREVSRIALCDAPGRGSQFSSGTASPGIAVCTACLY